MCSKYDSDATYCSEVEKLLIEPAGKKSCKNWPVRRSLRLSQKHKMLNNVSWEDMHIARIGKTIKIGNKLSGESRDLKENKFTEDIFTIHDIREDQVINFHPTCDISLKDHLRGSKDVKHVSNLNCVPLDLSKKSEVLTTETPQGLKHIKDAAVDLWSCNFKNDKEYGNMDDISRRKKRGRTKKSFIMPKNSNEELNINTKHTHRKKFEKGLTKTASSQRNIIYSEEITEHLNKQLIFNSSNETKSIMRTNKSNDDFLTVSSKRFKLSREDKETNGLQNQNKLSNVKRVLRKTSNANKLCQIQNSNSIKVDAGTNITNLNKAKIGKSLNKMQKVSCGNIKTNELQIQSRYTIDHIKSSNETKNKTTFNKSKSASKTCKPLHEKSVKNKRVVFKQSFSKFLKDTQSVKKLQKIIGSSKIKSPSVENFSKNNTQVHDILLDPHQHIKSEAFKCHDIYVEPSSANIKEKVSTKTSNKTKSGKAKIIDVVEGDTLSTSTDIYLNSYNTRSLRRKRDTTDNTNCYNILDKNISNNKNVISSCVNEIKRFKTELISQKSLEETNLKNASEKKSSKNSINLSGPTLDRDESKINKLENQLPSFTKDDCHILQNNQQSNEELKTTMQIGNKNSLSKNYLKSFDRSQFLEKIQNSRNYLDKLSAENNSSSKLNISQMPLTPAESTPELLKKSILPDVYPPHFKYQLPPESVHTCSLDPQTTSVITPDNTASSELLHSSSSSPSLPESLCELFQTKDIKSILNVERVSYRLNYYHIQALALMLNMRLEYLRKILDKIMNIKPTVLKNVDNVVKMPFVQDYDLFETSPNEPWASDEVVFNSQSPKQHINAVIGVLNGDFTPENKTLNESVKRRTVVGPWKNVSEFSKVYEWLFGVQHSSETRLKALNQIQIWKLRRSTLCPAAVLATSVIIDVQLKDSNQNKLNDEELQILYSNAFTRFFNFMSSIMQSHNMRTMYQTAKELGLQSFVVDLRHICAHGQVLPPLQVLRNTAEYCVSWLHDYYWASQRNTMCDVDAAHIRRKDKSEFDVNVSELFVIYDSALEGLMKGATNLKSLKRTVHGKRFNALKEFYINNKLTSLQATFDVVVQELCALVKRDVAIKDMTEIYVEAFLKMTYFFTLNESHLVDKDFISLISVTQTLFRMLAVYGFVEDLFLSLIEITENPIAGLDKRAGASFWAVEIAKGFQAFRQCKKMYKAELDADTTIKEAPFKNSDLTQISEGTRELLIYSGIDMKRTIIFGDHFRRPWVWVFERNFIEDRLEAVNAYTAPILKSLLPLVVPELNKNEINTLTRLIDCIFEANTETELTENSAKGTLSNADKLYTDIDLLNTLNNTENIEMAVEEENNDVAKVQYGIWTLMPDDETHDWKSCPLGRLPWE